MKKLLIGMLSVVMTFAFTSFHPIQAKEIEHVNFENEVFYFAPNLLDNEDDIHNIILPRAIGPVTVFIAGILAGYVINGTVIYATGVSVDQHIANAMHAATIWIKNRNVNRVYMTSSGSVQYAYDSEGCYVPPIGDKVCPRKLEVDY